MRGECEPQKSSKIGADKSVDDQHRRYGANKNDDPIQIRSFFRGKAAHPIQNKGKDCRNIDEWAPVHMGEGIGICQYGQWNDSAEHVGRALVSIETNGNRQPNQSD